MKLVKPTIILLLCAAIGVTAQTSRRRVGSRATPPATAPAAAQPTPLPASTPAPPVVRREPAAPVPLVVVNGQTITTADIDPTVRTEVDSIEDKIAAARKQVLDLQINTLLLEIEAKKRRVSSQQFYDVEVAKRIVEPTDAEITAFIAQNRSQLDQTDDLRSRVAGFLRADREARLGEELVQRLRKTTPVVSGADINTPNLGPSVVVATVGGQQLTAGVLNERLKPIIYRLRANVYDMEKQAADRAVRDILLIAEANRRKIGPEEIIRAEVSDKVHTPTEAEVAKFYAENRDRIKGELNTERRNQLALYMMEEDQRRLEQALSDRLRKGADIRWLIAEPQPPVQVISTDDDPSRGSPNAAATIVEFTDFQCPACAAMQPVLDEVLKSYGDKVRFVVRDYPLLMHANARKAAEAANAANAQGKFFEYTALLFKRQNALDVPSLKKYASEIGLDRAKFDAALDSGMYAAEVRHDIQDGEIYGIESTPTIFINGVRLEVLSAEGLRAAIDRALAAK